MALRRRQQIGKADGGFSYTYDSPPPPSAESSSSSSSASSLAAKAIRASSAYRDSSLSSVYEQSALSSPHGSSPSAVRDPSIYDHAPKKSINGSKQGFWGVLAQKAKSIIDEDTAKKHETPRETTFGASDRSKRGQYHSTYDSQDSRRKTEGPGIQKGLDAIASSLNYIGGTIGKSLEEGITAVENRTAGLIQETRKVQIRKKNNSSGSQNQASDFDNLRRQPMQQSHVQPKNHSTEETQLKASRDVEMATTAKAKLLMREMNTVKADFAFAKDRCAQLEEENRMLRESREKGDNPDDDDLIRLQLESLLAEKARLAQENSVYARENRFLREIVEYHQLTMQDVVYFDEGSEEVTEVYPIKLTTASNIQPSAASPTPTVPNGAIKAPQNVSLKTALSVDFQETPQTTGTTNPYVQMPGEDVRKN
ncbi:uncharacterized protein LOC121740839 [Salvia splendens]|uniref:uncharacterized protein LOC121740839 n=1 Tax=Salvia splendens TaxID=180675 RepID=UPI001C26653D|nr:uncharacterized protein LOC121740839 [Salvia splendens]XP_041989402.1 uncharacterized protein LOC121740839 [Salvia splendens]